MRIVGGSNRGRPLAAPAGSGVRPTADRTREALFNMLEHGGFGPDGASALPGARVLDAFCGTGALAFEALSRGAAQASLLDVSEGALAAARANAGNLGETARVAILRRDATAPGPAPAAHDLAFLDPPYGSGLAMQALPALAAAGWLAPDALVVLEVAARDPVVALPGFELLRERRYGAARIMLLRFAARPTLRDAPFGCSSG